MKSRLYRSQTNLMIAGVCGGIAKYLRIDAILVRFFFLLLAMAGSGIGIFVYLLLWIILPYEGVGDNMGLDETVRLGSEEIRSRASLMGDDLRRMVNEPNQQLVIILGSALVLLGGYLLLQNLELPWLYWLDFDTIMPILLILGGILLLWRYFRR